MNYLKRQLVGMREIFLGSLQGKQIVGAEVALVVGRALAFQNRFANIHQFVLLLLWSFVDSVNRLMRVLRHFAQALNLQYKCRRRFSTEVAGSRSVGWGQGTTVLGNQGFPRKCDQYTIVIPKGVRSVRFLQRASSPEGP